MIKSILSFLLILLIFILGAALWGWMMEGLRKRR